MTAIKDTFHPEPPLPSVDEILRNIAEEQARRRAEQGLPPLTAPKEMTGQIVETVERLGPAPRPWGFVLLRATYGDDEHWEAFKTRFWELLKKSVDPEMEVGWERIRDDLRVEMVEDVALDHAGLAERNKYVHIHIHCVILVSCLQSLLGIFGMLGKGVPLIQGSTCKCFSLSTRTAFVRCSTKMEMGFHLCLRRMLNMDSWRKRRKKKKMLRNHILDSSKCPLTPCLTVSMLACKAWVWLQKSSGPLQIQSLKAPIFSRLFNG
jgi:hypothetical protein